MVYWVTAYLMLYAPLQLAGCLPAHLCGGASRMLRSERPLEGRPIIWKLVRLGYLPLSTPTFDVLCKSANSNLCQYFEQPVVMFCISCYRQFGSLAIQCVPNLITESSLCSTI